jgi:hypothetical protein
LGQVSFGADGSSPREAASRRTVPGWTEHLRTVVPDENFVLENHKVGRPYITGKKERPCRRLAALRVELQDPAVILVKKVDVTIIVGVDGLGRVRLDVFPPLNKADVIRVGSGRESAYDFVLYGRCRSWGIGIDYSDGGEAQNRLYRVP